MDFWRDATDLTQRIERYRSLGTQDDILDQAACVVAERVWLGAQSTDSCSPTEEDSSRFRNACYLLGWWHFLRYEHVPFELSDPGELARAIVYFAEFPFEEWTVPADLLTLLPGHRADPRVQASVAAGLLRSVQDSGDLTAVEAAIVICSSDVEANPEEQVQLVGLLAVAHRLRFQHAAVGEEDPEDLRLAVEGGELMLTALRPEDPRHVPTVGNLAVAYRLRFGAHRDWEDLRRVIELGESATNAAHPERDDMLADLATAYDDAYEHTGELSYLHACASSADQAIAAFPDDTELLVTLGLKLCYVRQALFGATGDHAELASSIEVGLRVVTAAPAGWPEQTPLLLLLSKGSWVLFDCTGAAEDLRRAVELSEQAIRAIPEDNRLPDFVLTQFAKLVDIAGADPDAMGVAIEFGERILEVRPSRTVRSVLASAYAWRFLQTGVTRDLDSALRHADQVLAGLAADHPQYAWLTGQTAGVHLTASESGRRPAHLDSGIEMLERVLADSADALTDRDRAAAKSNLATALLYRARLRHTPEDIASAIDLTDEALRLLAHDDPARAAIVAVQGSAWHARFDVTRNAHDLREAVRATEQALATGSGPASDRLRLRWLANLAQAYQDLHDRVAGEVDHGRVAALAEQWRAGQTGEPAERMYAGFALGSLTHAMGDHDIAIELLDAAVALLPTTAPRANGWYDNEPRLRNHFGLTEEAVAAHITGSDPRGAVEIAEAGRGVLLSSALDTRSDLTDLAAAQPGLARAFDRSRRQFDAVGAATRPGTWAGHQRLLEQIRATAGFERFLRPPRFTDLRSSVPAGAAVLVNSGRHRSDAIIVTGDAEPIVVALPGLRNDGILFWVASLLGVVGDPPSLAGTLRQRRVLGDLLAWLWTTTAERVFDALGPPGPEAHRVWWVPTGLLGLFPWHAAGLPGRPGSLDLAVSSYAPTLRVLAHAHSRPVASTRRQLTVALEHTPGLPRLPGTVAEAAHLHASRPGPHMLVDSAATVAAVRAALPATTWAHFACHAVSDFNAPAGGAIHLEDGVITVTDISRLRLQSAELAYLSACSTADRGLGANESINLASAFHLAGFRHVIATLWPLNDTIAAGAARAFYQHLPDGTTADDAALALHRVIRKLRAEHPNRPDLWAGLIHSGP
ncbi:CHAT domain-containing protein [Streptomyces sp. NBC_00723]|uniref:CHAT domain-containing protein n=1 Tax=Streptomyces sp. NBC_00723 TaxID=2903673 RepID=UPI003865C0A3